MIIPPVDPVTAAATIGPVALQIAKKVVSKVYQ